MSMAIELLDVSLRLGGRLVLDGLSLQVARGETLALLGPSGSGKSTLIRVLSGLQLPDRGRVRLRGEPVTEGRRIVVSPEDRGLAVVFQDLALWPHLTVGGNLRFVLRARRGDRREEAEKIARALEQTGLGGFEGRYPAELSGGERQRVAIARALVVEPDIVLFDEPMSNLDVQLKRELLGLVEVLLRPPETTALWVTHDPREAFGFGQRVAVLEAGRVVQTGSREALCAAPATEFVRAVVEELGG